MANEKLVYTESFEAGEDLSDYQYHGMTMKSTRVVERFDGTTDIPAGVLMNDPESGEEAQLMVIGRSPVVLAENVTSLPQLMRFDADGHAVNFDVDTDVTTYCAGQFLETGSSGEKVEAMICCITPFRGEE
jgi:hypothetical protein